MRETHGPRATTRMQKSADIIRNGRIYKFGVIDLKKSKVVSKALMITIIFAFIVNPNIFVNRALANSENVALGKTPSSNALISDGYFATDGVAEDSNSFADLGAGLNYIQIDFGDSYDIRKVKLWHYFADGRIYKDVIVMLSNDPTFSAATTVFNNDFDNSANMGIGMDAEYAETESGKIIVFNPVNAQYLRIYSNGSNKNGYNHYTEVQAWTAFAIPKIPGEHNMALGKALTSNTSIQNESLATDGETGDTSAFANLGAGLNYIQIDFGESYDIRKIKLWHYFADGRTYKDVIVRLSNDLNFANATTVFNNDSDNSANFGWGMDAEYKESSLGKTIVFNPVNARYLRIYSNGSNKNAFNHYVEVQAWAADMATPSLFSNSINVLHNKIPTSNMVIGGASLATDGDYSDSNAFLEIGSGLAYIQYDFGVSYDIHDIKIWRYFADKRKYKDLIVQLSNDPSFHNATTVYNNDADHSANLGVGMDAEYTESSMGKTITFNPVHARYLRIYSNGSNKNPFNHYVEIQAWTYNAADRFRSNNVTYLNPEWVMYPQSTDFIMNVLNNMENYGIKYQMIDAGFFDRVAGTATFEDTVGGLIDGTMDANAYSELSNWVAQSRLHKPNMKLIGSVSGNSYLHTKVTEYYDRNDVLHIPSIDKATMHDRVAAHCKYLVDTFGLDGINIDFEPLIPGSASDDYRLLIGKIRTQIGPNKELSIAGSLFPDAMPDNEITQFGELLDMIVVLDYDTGSGTDIGPAPYPANFYTSNAASYKIAVKENIKRYSAALPANCKLIPLGPGVYNNTLYHSDYENALNHSLALNSAILEGARVDGSGVWWFADTMENGSETKYFIDYWVKGTQSFSLSNHVIKERMADDGGITDVLKVTLAQGTFSNDIATGVSVNRLPAGLGFSVQRNSDTQIAISFTGNAWYHGNRDDEKNATISIDGSKMIVNGLALTGYFTSEPVTFDFFGVGKIYDYDSNNRLRFINEWVNGSEVVRVQYIYDENGNLKDRIVY